MNMKNMKYALYVIVYISDITPNKGTAQVWHALSRDITVLLAHPRVYLRMERTSFAFEFPNEADPHLPTPEGCKAELA